MKVELAQEYKEQLDALAEEIQNSEELQTYLDTEEEDDYNAMKEQYEPRIAMLYDKVAEKDPLQLVSFEESIMRSEFEGLFLPKALGFSVLRGEGNDRDKYQHPQEHFKNMLKAVYNSANFDILKKRMGQTIQMGFAYSSDIWVTNLISEVENKRVRYYLQGHRLDRYRDPRDRRVGLARYKKQFVNENYQSATFPETISEMKVHFKALKSFLMYRVKSEYPNDSLVPHIKGFITNKIFQGTEEHLQITGLYAFFFDLDDANRKELAKVIDKVRADMENFDEKWLDFVLELHNNKDFDLTPEADLRIAELFDLTYNDEISEFYKLTNAIHNQGYTVPEVQEKVKDFYNAHEGLSTVNECVRKTIFSYFRRFMENLEVTDYAAFMEAVKTFKVYMGIFLNQKFNQDVKELCMVYVRKLLKKYTDKRGRDYQDIKKFVSVTFLDLKFLKEKEIVELFKTRRKRRKKAEAK